MAITFWGLIALSGYILFGISCIIAVIILFDILCFITWIIKLIDAANKPYISEELPLSMESLYALFQAFGSFVMLDGKFTENENKNVLYLHRFASILDVMSIHRCTYTFRSLADRISGRMAADGV